MRGQRGRIFLPHQREESQGKNKQEATLLIQKCDIQILCKTDTPCMTLADSVSLLLYVSSFTVVFIDHIFFLAMFSPEIS